MGATNRMKGGLASVIVTCDGPLPRTRRCVDALLRSTRRPWELIAVVDPDGACAAYLAGIRDAAPLHVEIVPRPDESVPFRHAPGLAVACGDYLALLDDGTLVTEGWLDGLSALADWDPRIGIVGPMLNDADPPQRAEAFGPASLREFAERWREVHRRQWITTDRLAASCLLLRRETYDAIADHPVLLADDLGTLARSRGFELAVLREQFVHHSRRGVDLDPARQPEPARLMPKGVPVDFFLTATRRRPRETPSRPRVSLTMIVRDEEHNLADCLDSIEGLCDEAIVVDTGSIDRTADVARSRGAKVVGFEWIDDFAAARNAALECASGRYAFWLDADDRADEIARDRLRDLFARLDHEEEAAYVMRQVSTGHAGAETASEADHIRLFPIRDDVRWTYRVHEQILPAITVAGIPVRWSEIGIGHLGYADSGLCDRKLERNLRILQAELVEKPGNALVLFNIGWAFLYRKELRAALGYLRACLASSSPRDAIIRKAYALIAQAYQRLGDPDSALAACISGRSVAPEDAGLLSAEALLRRDRGEWDVAEECWRRILDLGRPRQFSIVSPGIHGHLTRRKLADLAERRGDIAGALGLWDEVLSECPGDAEAKRARGRLAGPSSTVVAAG